MLLNVPDYNSYYLYLYFLKYSQYDCYYYDFSQALIQKELLKTEFQLKMKKPPTNWSLPLVDNPRDAAYLSSYECKRSICDITHSMKWNV